MAKILHYDDIKDLETAQTDPAYNLGWDIPVRLAGDYDNYVELARVCLHIGFNCGIKAADEREV